MEKIFISKILLAVLFIYSSINIVNAQNQTNTFPTNGSVGIGTNSPSSKLHIATTSASANDGIFLQHNALAWTRILSPSLTSGAFNSITQLGDAGVIFGANTGINNVANGFVIAPWRNGVASGLRIDQNGNVGIGTSLSSNPNGYKLAVNGAIGAKSLQIEISSSTWADYVFDKSYKLMPLSDVALFVDKNKHLPDIPTAADVEKNGIDVAQMNTLLLKKVEELTLYMIEMQKEIDTLKAKQ